MVIRDASGVKRLFLKLGEITACLWAGGNDPVEKGGNGGAGEGGRIAGGTSLSLSMWGAVGPPAQMHKWEGWPQT